MAFRVARTPPTTLGSRASWAAPTPLSPTLEKPCLPRPLSGAFDRIFNAFDRSNAFEYVSTNLDKEERHIGHGDIIVNRQSAGWSDCALAAHAPAGDDDLREKVVYSQARHLFPLQEDLAEWINKTIGITYLTGENFLDIVDNGVELCQLAAVIHDKARDAIDQGLIVGPVPSIKGRCWQRAARRSFFSRDNAENFITFCRDLGVHENLLFESDDLVLHNQPRQVILCLLEVARLATRYGVEPPGLVALEKEIALEERDSGMESAMSSAAWQFRNVSPVPDQSNESQPFSASNEKQLSIMDNGDAESTKSEGTVGSTDSDVPLKPTNELDKRVQLVTRLMERGCRCGDGKCSKLLKVKKVGEGRYNIAGRNVFIRLLKGRHMMVRVGGGWDTLEHFLSRHEPCQVRLVTAGRRADLLPVALPAPAPTAPADTLTANQHDTGKQSPTSRKLSVTSRTSSKSSLRDVSSPIDSKASSFSGKISPIEKESRSGQTDSGKSSPSDGRRTSTPMKLRSTRARSALMLPVNVETPVKTPIRGRKQSAPSLSTPTTPTGRPSPARTPPTLQKLTNAPKKSRSMSLALSKVNNEKSFCGTDRLNQSRSAATTPTNATNQTTNKKTRSQSLASTPVNENKFLNIAQSGYAKKTRSMSLANAGAEFRPVKKAATAGALTQAVIEESIRQSLAASVADDGKKTFLHIKAKYRCPPPREVPPR